MTDSPSQLIEKFHLYRLPVLPEILLQCSETFKGARPEGTRRGNARPNYSLSHIITSDPSLMLKILGTRDTPVSLKDLSGETLAGQLGEAGFTLLWSQAVVNDGLLSQEGNSLRFLRAHWAQSVRASLLMRKVSRKLAYEHPQAAGICGLLLTAGQMALAAIEPALYLQFMNNFEDLQECFFQEKRVFGITHNELMARILEQYRLPTMLCDAIKYQYEDVEAVESAPVLVRMAWLVRQMSHTRNLSPELEKYASDLLGMTRSDLKGAMDYADRGLEAMAEAWDIDELDPLYPPIKPVNLENLKAKYLRTRDKVLAKSNAIALSCMLEATTTAQLSAVSEDSNYLSELTSRGLRLFFGCQEFMLLRYERSAEALIPAGSTLPDELTQNLKFSCSPDGTGRGIAARSFLQGESLCLTADELSVVIDKQILRAFQCENLHTMPLEHEGKQVGLLLMGHNEHHPEDEGQQPELVSQFFYNLSAELLRTGRSMEQSSRDVNSLLEEQSLRTLVHEVNNPLSIIKNYLQLLSIKQGEDSAIREEIDVIKSEIDRVSTIVQDYSSRNSTSTKKSLSLNVVVEKISRIFRASLRQDASISITSTLDQELPFLHCNEDKLRQIITNLVKNAVEALDSGGTISITTGTVIDMQGDSWQELTVSDTGPGLDQEILTRLFRFGNTSKGGNHSGAGLAIVKKLSEELGARISCQSSGKGTSFSLLLPAPESPEVD